MLKILIVDDEADLLEIIEMAFEINGQTDLEFALNGHEAIEKIKKSAFDLVVCDYNMPNGTGGDVYSYIIDNSLELKFVLCSSDRPGDHCVFDNRHNLFYHIEKPAVIEGVKSCMAKLDIRDEASLEKYHPVSVKLLLNLKKPPMDVYLKITASKFLKVLNANEFFDELDFVKYTQKSIFNLYVLQEDFVKLSDICEAQINAKLDLLKSKTSLEEKTFAIADCHELLKELFHNFGFNQKMNDAAYVSIQVAGELMQNSKQLNLLFDMLLKKPQSYITKHSLILSVVTKMLANHLGWSNSIMDQKLVAASLFHDIGLKEDLNESEHLLKGNHDASFINHPAVAAEVLQRIENVPHDTHIIVLEQHEIGPEEGLPNGTHFSRISPLGLLFSFSHFYVDYLIESSSAAEATEKMELITHKTGQYKVFYKSLLKLNLV